MAEQLEWIYPFKTIIYSRDQLHRNRLSSAGTAEDKKSTVCIRNVGNDEVAGYLRFKDNSDDDSMNEVESTAKSIFTKFENSMILKGFTLQKTEFGKPKCVNGQGRSRRLRVALDSAYNVEGETKIIPKNSMWQIATFFNDIETDPKLLEMANDIKSQEKIRMDIGNFVWYWILFNIIYNPCQIRTGGRKQMRCYINSLEDAKIDALFNRNHVLFDSLSRSSIMKPIKKKSPNVFDELKKAIRNGPNRDVVNKSIDCVYELRNNLFHHGKLDFEDLPRLTNFVFDLVYLDQIMKYGENAVTSFYDVR